MDDIALGLSYRALGVDGRGKFAILCLLRCFTLHFAFAVLALRHLHLKLGWTGLDWTGLAPGRQASPAQPSPAQLNSAQVRWTIR